MQTPLNLSLTEASRTEPTPARPAGSVRARVLASMGALLVGQGVTAGIQLISLPMFLHFWDAARYGKWVMLSAVPTYFSISDGGVIPVAANKISMLHAGGDDRQANVVFQSALALILVAIVAVGSLVGGALLLIGDSVLDADSRLALWLLVLVVLANLFGGLCDAGFRGYGNYAEGVLYINAMRIVEFLGLAAGLLAGGSFFAAALGMFLGRLGATLALMHLCQRRFPQLHWGLRCASAAELKLLLRPAIGYLAFPLGNALSIQAITLMVGGMFGTAVVAVFNTYRTVSRLVLQLTSNFGHALWADFSRLFGSGDVPSLRRIYRRSLAINTGINFACSLAMVLAAAPLLELWTHGKIAFEAPLFSLFALATLAGGLSHVPRGLLLSTNRHTRLGAVFLALAAAAVVASYPAGTAFGPAGAVGVSIALEICMFVLTQRLAKRLLAEMTVRGRDVRS